MPTTLNEVLREYNDLGMSYREYQEHEGAKDANTLYVEYVYDTAAADGLLTKGMRPTSVRYPNGREISFYHDDVNRLTHFDLGELNEGPCSLPAFVGVRTMVCESLDSLGPLNDNRRCAVRVDCPASAGDRTAFFRCPPSESTDETPRPLCRPCGIAVVHVGPLRRGLDG